MLIDSIKRYFDKCNVALVDKFVPYYCSSIACHVANLENRQREFYIRQGKVQNLRLHIFFIAPPGFSKSLLLRGLLGDSTKRDEEDVSQIGNDYSALSRCDIETGFEGLLTEASYVGSFKHINNEKVIVKGAAWEHRKAILGVDEFSVLSDTMTLSYGKSLDKALLTSLDDGYLKKRLTGGKIQYITQLTLWTGSQPMRFDLSSGIGRRLLFIYFIPTEEEEKLIKDMSRREDKSLPSPQILNTIADDLELMRANISKLQSIEFEDKIYEVLDRFNVPHFEENLFRRLALGYNLAKYEDIDENMVVKMDDELEELFEKEAKWRKEIKKGPEVSQVMRILEDRQLMRISDLKEKLTDFGLSYKQATKAIRELKSAGIVESVKHNIETTGKVKRYIKLTELA